MDLVEDEVDDILFVQLDFGKNCQHFDWIFSSQGHKNIIVYNSI